MKDEAIGLVVASLIGVMMVGMFLWSLVRL